MRYTFLLILIFTLLRYFGILLHISKYQENGKMSMLGYFIVGSVLRTLYHLAYHRIMVTPLKSLHGSVQVGELVDYIESFGDPFLTLIDGRVIILEPTGSIFDSDIGWSGYASEFFNIEHLRSITFCGEEFVISTP